MVKWSIALTVALGMVRPVATHAHPERQLQNSIPMFVPNNCQAPCGTEAVPWSNFRFDTSQKVVIPCGQCVQFDGFDDGEPWTLLDLPGGLDIQGSFWIPTSRLRPVHIKTPFILVQGEFIARSRVQVTGEPLVRITLTGSDDSLTSFVPMGENEFKCTTSSNANTPQPCQVGPKPIVVAGGSVNWQGLPDDCKTWVHLQDVIATDLNDADPVVQVQEVEDDHPNPHCRGSILWDDATMMDRAVWTPGYGAKMEPNGSGGMRIYDRTYANEHGPLVDLVNLRDCLEADRVYLFEAQVRLVSETASGLSACAAMGVGCLQLSSLARFDGSQERRTLGQERETDAFEYAVWQPFVATFSFDADTMAANPIFHTLQLRGPDADLDVEIQSAKLLRPTAVTPVCNANLIVNGDAEAYAMHYYPMEHSSRMRVLTEETNQFFQVSFRDDDRDSIEYSLTDCLQAGARYKVAAKIRVDSAQAVDTYIVYRVFRSTGGSDPFVVAAECPRASRNTGWISCEARFALEEDFDSSTVDRVRFSFYTPESTATFDVDDWSLQLVAGAQTAIVVPAAGVQDCWGPGAEILITSHTTSTEDGQVRRLVSEPQPLSEDPSLVLLELDQVIAASVTAVDSPDFAVEVALLSRNVVIEGAKDEADALLGGHVIILQTPDIAQSLDGVEFRNLGRQGQLGRYPIHFHLCGDVSNSIVSRNSIRDSNQRCVVVHGTYNLQVEENVAFETFGHCYMTEDGGEIGNKWIRNLGASTRHARRIVRSFETDNSNPSTFWISNPSNEWIGNCAAGSEANGFWFEMDDFVRPPTSRMPLSDGMRPRRMTLSVFRDNVSHSNFKHGLRTYPHGFQPPMPAVLDNTRSYKNRLDGIFFHQTRDMVIQGGILADNNIAADFDIADNIVVDGTTIIGATPRFKQIASSQNGVDAHDDLIGLELHSFLRDPANEGATIRNVDFVGFADSGASHVALIEIDSEVKTGQFDYWTSIEGVSVEDGISDSAFDFTSALGAGINNIFLTDVDSAMNPAGGGGTGVSSIVSATPEMTAFLEDGSCQDYSEERGYLYCEGLCLRTVTFATDPYGTEDMLLRIVNVENPSQRQVFPGLSYEQEGMNELDYRRFFAAALPPGNYRADFVSGQGGDRTWPTYVELTYEPAHCEGALAIGSIDLVVPPAPASACQELFRNHVSLIQPVDSRCLVEGAQFDVRVWVQLERNGAPVACDNDECAELRQRLHTPADEGGSDFDEATTVILSNVARPFDATGWNLLQGVVNIDGRMAAASNVLFFLEAGNDMFELVLDSASMSLIPPDCSELVFNGDLSEGSSVFWEKEASQNSRLEMVAIAGDSALALTGRTSDSDRVSQDIRIGCMVEGERYLATARVKLLSSDGSSFVCNPNLRTGNLSCPRLRLRSFIDLRLPTQDIKGHEGGSIAVTDHGRTSDGWYTISGVFTATDFDGIAEKSVLTVEGVRRGKDVILDDVSIRPLALQCSELLLNGNAQDGPTARFWRAANVAETAIDVVQDTGVPAFKVSNRGVAGDGLVQDIDARCLVPGSVWELSARMKLGSESSQSAVRCDPSDTRVASGCPPLRVSGFRAGENVYDESFYMTSTAPWRPGAFNDYSVSIAVSAILANCDSVSIGIRNFNVDWTMVVTDLSFHPG